MLSIVSMYVVGSMSGRNNKYLLYLRVSERHRVAVVPVGVRPDGGPNSDASTYSNFHVARPKEALQICIHISAAHDVTQEITHFAGSFPSLDMMTLPVAWGRAGGEWCIGTGSA